ncbi:MAG: YmdB family metallophosphoesterase [Lentisphaeria bacterium]|nr:YmdB family metallophosphoesterase [Lentisphaeria bacterium]
MSSGPVLNLIFVGDIVGKGGRNAVKALIPELKKRHNASFVIANGENCANGAGFSLSCIQDMESVVDVFTGGDHTWDQKNFEQEIRSLKNMVRPANFSTMQPGKGWSVFRNPASGEVAVISLVGKVFMKDSAYCPFETVEKILKEIPPSVKCIIVDIHAEATSEKAAMAWFLDGKVTAVLGTHTHVQTADARILPGGTAFLSDVGMTGGQDSILGRDICDVVKKFRTGMPTRLNVTEKNIRLDYAVVSYELMTGHAVSVRAYSEFYHPENM